VLCALPAETGDLREACLELSCLHWVEQHTPELAGDATARRELRARLAAAEHAVRSQIRDLFLPSGGKRCRWFHEGKGRFFAWPRELNAFLSDEPRVSTCTMTAV
jgi:hypothetical protein